MPSNIAGSSGEMVCTSDSWVFMIVLNSSLGAQGNVEPDIFSSGQPPAPVGVTKEGHSDVVKPETKYKTHRPLYQSLQSLSGTKSFHAVFKVSL